MWPNDLIKMLHGSQITEDEGYTDMGRKTFLILISKIISEKID